MKKILITGGGGLIGQAISKRHFDAGDDVYIYDLQLNKFNDYNNLIGTNLTYIGDIGKVIKNTRFDVISHQAAHVGVGESQYNIEKYISNNVEFTSRLIQSVLDNLNNRPDLLILAGSMGPYGEGPYLCTNHGTVYPDRKGIEIFCPYCSGKISPLSINENCKINPKSIYAMSKFSQEEMIRIFSETYNIPSVSLRYFSVYGQKSNPNNPFTGVLSVIGNKIINSKKVCLFEDGEQTRDLISATDIAEAHFLCTRKLLPRLFDSFNIGTGLSVSLKQVASLMLQLMNSKKELIFTGDYRIGDIKHSQANIEKFSKEYDWSPKISIESSIIEYTNFLNLNWNTYSINTDINEQENIRLKKLGLI